MYILVDDVYDLSMSLILHLEPAILDEGDEADK